MRVTSETVVAVRMSDPKVQLTGDSKHAAPVLHGGVVCSGRLKACRTTPPSFVGPAGRGMGKKCDFHIALPYPELRLFQELKIMAFLQPHTVNSNIHTQLPQIPSSLHSLPDRVSKILPRGRPALLPSPTFVPAQHIPNIRASSHQIITWQWD